ncbi:MAG: hypothetical protein IVW53_14790 [Chloroflexi bacterium]|nr:hypothetical protein [Chloroflexota bacterium]MBF6606833.1 hypothetical protein [Chloroflexota bacterium]
MYAFPEFDLSVSAWSHAQSVAMMGDAVAAGIDDREFAVRTLGRQIVAPRGTGANELRSWADDRLQALLRAFLDRATTLFSIDAEVASFETLRAAVRRRREEEEAAYAPLLAQIKSMATLPPGMLAALEQTQQSLPLVTETIAAAAAQAERAVAQFQVTLAPILDRITVDYAAALRILAPDTQAEEQVRYLLTRGWYPSPEMPSYDPEIARLAAAGNIVEVDRRMANFAERRLGHVAIRVRSSFPARAPFVEDAVWAHRNRRYTLTAPALLAQADGAFYDIIGEQLYRKGGTAAREALNHLFVLRGTEQWWARTVLLPIDEGSSLVVNTAQRTTHRQGDPDYGPLNRHGVLHGVDLDYPTRENSLRAFTLLDYLCWLSQIVQP